MPTLSKDTLALRESLIALRRELHQHPELAFAETRTAARVAAFLEGRIPFTAIAEVIESVLDETETQPVTHFEELYECDRAARELAERLVDGRVAA